MGTEQAPLSSREMMQDMLRRHYRDAREAKKEGRLVCWSTSIAPQELLTTMDIVTLYPENHAAAIGSRKGSMEFIAHTESMGYSSDLCSYARVNLAYAKLQYSQAENMPLPDFLLCTNNICHTVLKWYENLSKELKIPLIMFDTPFNHTDEVQEHNIKYMNAQLHHAIDQLEDITGKKFDLDGIVFHSNRSCKLMDFRQYEVQRRVLEECGIPSVIFDGDQTDPRLFSETQYETRIQALAEMMQENKRKKARLERWNL